MRWCETFGTAARVRFIKGAIVERYFGRLMTLDEAESLLAPDEGNAR